MVKRKKFFEKVENKRNLVTALIVALVLVGVEMLQFIFNQFMQFFITNRFLLKSLTFLFTVLLLTWLIFANEVEFIVHK